MTRAGRSSSLSCSRWTSIFSRLEARVTSTELERELKTLLAEFLAPAEHRSAVFLFTQQGPFGSQAWRPGWP